MSTWSSVKLNGFPAPHPHDPSRSIMVLTCEEGVNYSPQVVARYYDFANTEWKNDALADKLEKKPYVTHWLPLPDKDHPDWISARVRKPVVPGEMNEYEGKVIYSIHVLVCDKSGDLQDYHASILSAQSSLSIDYWYAFFPEEDPDSPTLGEASVSHWMPLPDAPLETGMDY